MDVDDISLTVQVTNTFNTNDQITFQKTKNHLAIYTLVRMNNTSLRTDESYSFASLEDMMVWILSNPQYEQLLQDEALSNGMNSVQSSPELNCCTATMETIPWQTMSPLADHDTPHQPSVNHYPTMDYYTEINYTNNLAPVVPTCTLTVHQQSNQHNSVGHVSSMHSSRRSRPYRIVEESKQCADCHTKYTPLWRTGLNGTILCNKCGLRLRRKLAKERRSNKITDLYSPF